MKIRPHHAIVLIVLLLTACSPVVYEAPHASHGRYDPYPATVVIHHDHRYTPQHRHRIEQELLHRHTRCAPIYQGRGRHGDLIEVTIRGGHLYHQGRRIKYDPVSFRIARGDIIRLPASGLQIDLFVRYDHGRLAMDTDIFGSYAYTLITIDTNHDFGSRRAYRLHNDHIRDARVTVTAVSHDNHQRAVPGKISKKAASHGPAAVTGKTKAIAVRDIEKDSKDRQHGQDSNRSKTVQSDKQKIDGKPGWISEENVASGKNRPERNDREVLKRQQPSPTRQATTPATRQQEAAEKRAVASKPRNTPPVLRHQTVNDREWSQQAGQAVRTARPEQKQATQVNDGRTDAGKGHKAISREISRDKNKDKSRDENVTKGQGNTKDKDKDKNEVGNRDQAKDRTEGSERSVQNQELWRSRMAGATTTTGR